MDFNEEPTEQEFDIVFADRSRLGPAQNNSSYYSLIENSIRNGDNMTTALRKGGQFRTSPSERFKILSSIYYNKFGGDSQFSVDFQKILRKAETLKWVPYYNPIGFVMGALILDRQKNIDKTRLDLKFEDNIETMNEENITKEDVIRYARLWKQ